MLQTVQQSLEAMQQQNAQNAQNAQNQHQAPPRDKLGEFQRTKPPTFSHTVDPLDADDWFNTVTKKLAVARCNDREKVLFASHLLEGSAANW